MTEFASSPHADDSASAVDIDEQELGFKPDINSLAGEALRDAMHAANKPYIETKDGQGNIVKTRQYEGVPLSPVRSRRNYSVLIIEWQNADGTSRYAVNKIYQQDPSDLNAPPNTQILETYTWGSSSSEVLIDNFKKERRYPKGKRVTLEDGVPIKSEQAEAIIEDAADLQWMAENHEEAQQIDMEQA